MTLGNRKQPEVQRNKVKPLCFQMISITVALSNIVCQTGVQQGHFISKTEAKIKKKAAQLKKPSEYNA